MRPGLWSTLLVLGVTSLLFIAIRIMPDIHWHHLRHRLNTLRLQKTLYINSQQSAGIQTCQARHRQGKKELSS